MDRRSVSWRRTSWLGASCLIGAWLSAFVYVQAQAPASQPAPQPASQGAPPPSQPGPPAGPRPQGGGGAGQGGPPRRAPGESPASEKRPVTLTKQTYPAAQIEAGQTRFASMCGFCHGRDAAGGESGPDLTRSALVASDVRGNKLGPMIRAGRPDKGMPPFTIPDTDLIAIVAFIHDAKVKAEALGGGRRSVEPADLQTGNASAGKAYFTGAGGCATCHQLTGDFATIGARYQGLPLLQRMLYPGSGGRTNNPPPAPAVMTIKTGDGKTVTGKLVYRDEFTITVMDADGWTRSWPVAAVTISGEDPLKAHVDQLGKYTEADMHDVFAFLQSLR
jgi:cytochrome c oxidase cbb3-type subunit 3